VESLTSGDGSVTMQLEPWSGGVRISVADTGRGMSRDELVRAFDDFHTTKPNGTGLGLSVVHRLASDMGAAVHVDSMPGKGTTVTVTLPAFEQQPLGRSLPPSPRFPIPDSQFPTP
jgi:two-component system sensor histidine kinase HydH